MGNNIQSFIDDFRKKGEIYVRIKVTPKYHENKVIEVLEDNTIKIGIQSIPERGKANKELIDFLKREFNAKEVTIISGGRSQIKLVKLIS